MANAKRRRNQIAGQFIVHPRQMIESPAWRALSLGARRALDRIELEHMSHGGAENGKLPVTYLDFEHTGVRRHSVAPAIRELAALGFIEIMRKGYHGAAELRAPSLYRLTYLRARDAGYKDATGSHDYLKIKTDEEAEKMAAVARRATDPRNVERGKIHFATPQNVRISPHEKGGDKPNSRPPKRGVQVHPTKRGVLSISRDISDTVPTGDGERTDADPS
jgi:hypothetical protein